MKKYPYLFSPFKLKNVTFRNRIFATPTGLTWPDEYSCVPGHSTVLFYEKKARGGAASVTLGETAVNRVDCVRRPNADQILPDFERLILPKKNWVKITDAIKRHGAVPSIQLSHGGQFSEPFFIGGRNPIGPNGFTKENGTVVRAMEEDDIVRIANDFGETAWHAKDAGFQKVMVHGGHGWLLGQFLSPAINRRTDRFGGSPENRARFPMMVLDAIRQRVGDDFLIELRISGDEHQPGGWPIEEAIAFVKMVEDKIDLLHISAGDYHNSDHYVFPTIYQPHGCNVHVAEAMKKAGVKVPLVTVGAMSDPREMERLVAAGITDFVAVGRALLADSDLPKKAFSGHEDDIRPCLRCSNCIGGLYDGLYQCDVNPLAGNEIYTVKMPEVGIKKRVLIVGGGPGGMTAAITAAERGHEVTLVEKSDVLGGTLKFTDVDSHKQDLRNYKNYLIHQVHKHAIDVRLNTEASLELLTALNPQAIIVASGAKATILKAKGADSENVFHATTVYETPDVIGDKVVMIGGGLMGCEVALHLAESGKHVTILELKNQLAPDSNIVHKAALYEMIEKMNDRVLAVTNAKVIEVAQNGVTYLDQNGNEQLVTCDTVLYAIGMTPNDAIVEELRLWPDWESFIPIGDCTGASIVRKAIHGGYFAAMDII